MTRRERLVNALTDDWTPTSEVAQRAGISPTSSASGPLLEAEAQQLAESRRTSDRLYVHEWRRGPNWIANTTSDQGT